MELRRKDAKLVFGNAPENIQPVLEWACRTYPEFVALSIAKQILAADMLVSEPMLFSSAYRPSHLSLKRDGYSGKHSSAGNGKLPEYPGVDIQSLGCNVFLPGAQSPKCQGRGYRMVFDDLDSLLAHLWRGGQK
ncbi:Mycobacterium rhizamassiliense ORFan [Mycobacterium rhizamassiliense]|uniref:Mycobacterium rhizamassiliense ORFan n=1 Tax=Mycobacterium rhizamassiliense TaxID=1841860 RepID=A0A2U3NW99_9MYCO|nr:hypothetical protein [Mycobacterium rhizamassiliense]SPM35786.1 Mycobacterium rhizamassiliense ORFan [Mycobacterium rhizamassiliense]